MLTKNALGILGAEKRPKMGKVIVYAIAEGCMAAVVPVMLVALLLTNAEFDARSLAILIAVVFIALVIRYLVGTKAVLECQITGADFIRQARMVIGEHLSRVPLGFFQRFRSGDLTSRLMSNLQDVELVITHYYNDLVTGATAAVITGTCLLVVDWRLGLVALAVIPLAIPTLIATQMIMRSVGRRRYAVAGEMNDAFVEFLTGIHTLKAHDMGLEKLDVLKGSIDKSMRTSIKLEASMAPVIILFHIILDVGLLATLLVGISFLSGNTLDAREFAAVVLLAFVFYKPIKAISIAQAEMRNSEQAAKTIRGILDEPTQSWIEARIGGDGAALGLPLMQFKNVTFCYDGEKPAVQDLSFEVRSGSVMALVGPSGSGKTTAANLAMRLWDPDQGRILYRGRDIATIRPETLLSEIGVVFQDVYLFNDTVRANIAIAREGATEAEVVAAAQAANADEFIRRLPEGYDTVLAEGGASLSGGEKQRIAIARCILKDAPFVILDEATASLDPENEREIQEALARLLAERTVLVIAHRLKTIKAADHVVVLDQGRCVEAGTHEALMDLRGTYAAMWRNQEESEGWSLKKVRSLGGPSRRTLGDQAYI